MAALTAGDLRHRIVLERRVETEDGAGGVTVVWIAEAAFWALIEPAGAASAVFGEARQVRPSHRIAFRRRSDVLPNTRIRHDGRIFRVLTVADRDRTRTFQIASCEELP